MLTRLTGAACGALLLLGAPATAQTTSTISVVGEGRIETAPDRFVLTAEVQGAGADQTEALRNLVESQTAVTDAVTHLRGLTGANFTTGLPSVVAVYPPDCELRRSNGSKDCPATGYLANLTLTLKASPADQAGNAVSLAAESGARSAQIAGYETTDLTDVERRALAAAFADARRQADEIAQAAGQRVTGIVRADRPVSDRRTSALIGTNLAGESLNLWAFDEYQDPEVPLAVSPAPIRHVERLNVTFAIE